MNLIEKVKALVPEMLRWRQDLHACPETAFQEVRTAEYAAARLTSFGLEVQSGIGRTGVVATLKKGPPGQSIGLRADIDALDVAESNDFAHRSQIPGKMHACGHDGHMAMLMGAAKYLAEAGRFNGTVYFIFQPAEENEGGADAMVHDGLFDRFPMAAIYGLHNFPHLPFGAFAIRPGPMMAGSDSFDIIVKGSGGHAAMPNLLHDPLPCAAQIVMMLQTIVSRNTDPFESAVVGVTQVHAGTTYNIIPEEVVLRGTVRYFNPAVQDMIEARIREIAAGAAAAMGLTAEVRYCRRYPPVVNSVPETALAVEAAARLVGRRNVVVDMKPSMGSEDFAFLLQKKPGAYIHLGAGAPRPNGYLHQSGYDFNDELLPIGAAYWISLVESQLSSNGV